MVKRTPHLALIAALERRRGSMEDRELYEELSRTLGLSYVDFMKLLMKLEVSGLVRVYRLSRDRFRVELTV